jgi:hypothetical protein
MGHLGLQPESAAQVASSRTGRKEHVHDVSSHDEASFHASHLVLPEILRILLVAKRLLSLENLHQIDCFQRSSDLRYGMQFTDY